MNEEHRGSSLYGDKVGPEMKKHIQAETLICFRVLELVCVCADAGLPFLILVPHLHGHKPTSITKFKEASLLSSHWRSVFAHINGCPS